MNIAGFCGISIALLLSALTARAAEEDFALHHRLGPKHIPFTFSFKFALRGRSETPSLSRIVVTNRSWKQTLRDESEEPQFIAADQLEEKVRFVDLNGDGWDDLVVPAWSSPMGNNGFCIWAYLPSTGRFTFSPELSGESNPEPKGRGVVATHNRDGGGYWTDKKFRWNGEQFAIFRISREERRNDQRVETQKTKRHGRWVQDYSRTVTH